MKKRADLFQSEVSSKRLYTSVKEISNYHRIQVTQGFRDAANYVYNALRNNGINAKILTYKADGDIWYLQNKMFQEWKLNKAVLTLADPEMKLADAIEEPISVVQRSYPCNFEDGLELVVMDRGTNEEDYADVDLSGKMIFMHEHFSEFEWTFDKGIKGFVTDHIAENSSRTRNDLYHSLTYTSFWWKHTPDEKHTFGFVLSPCMGDQLVNIYYDRKKRGLPTVLKGVVDTEMNPGVMEVVEATLPGLTDEEVILTSHLCHPKTSANDNASGCAANIEALRVLRKLMDEGKIARNKRTIKAVFMPEFTGTYAYLYDHNDYKKMVGALNLDMVGGKQTRAYGPITLTLLPDSMPSIVQPLAHLSLELAGRETDNLLNEKIAVTHYVTETFFGGSDHLVYSNPDFSIPCCMLGQWPDRNYHTATDTLDVIDPEVLSFSTRVALNYAYNLSNFTEHELTFVTDYLHMEMMDAYKRIHVALTEGKISREMAYDCVKAKEEFYKNCANDIKRILPEVTESIVSKELDYVQASCELFLKYLGLESGLCFVEDNRVFVKNFIGPIQGLGDNVAVSNEEAKQLYKTYTKQFDVFGDVADRCVSYIDGVRTAGEIKKCINLEFMRNLDEVTDAYLNLLVTMGMVECK